MGQRDISGNDKKEDGGINIHFHSVDIFDDNGGCAGKQFLKTWWNWKGVIPQNGDIVLLHWGKHSEEEDAWKVIGRTISGLQENDLNLFLTQVNIR